MLNKQSLHSKANKEQIPVVLTVADGGSVFGLFNGYYGWIGSLDKTPYWNTSSGQTRLSELAYLSKFEQDKIRFTETLEKNITVYNEYGGSMTAAAGTIGYSTGDGEGVDPLNLTEHKGGTMNLTFAPPQTVIYKKNKENPTLCKEGRINVYQECDGFSTIIHNWGSRVKQIACGIWSESSCVSVSRIGTYCNNSGIQHCNSDRNSGRSVDSNRQPESESGRPNWRILHVSRRSIIRRNDGANGTGGLYGKLWFRGGGSYCHKGSCVADIFNELMNLLGASPRMEVCHA